MDVQIFDESRSKEGFDDESTREWPIFKPGEASLNVDSGGDRW